MTDLGIAPRVFPGPYPEDSVDQSGWKDGSITDTQSEAYVILDAAFKLVSIIPFFSGFTIKRISSALPVELGWQIPYVGVYDASENGTAIGNWNTGQIGFNVALTLGFQVVIKDNDPAACVAKLDQAKWALFNGLLRSNAFTNMISASAMQNPAVTNEGFPRFRARKRWGKTGSANETPVGELQFELETRHPILFAPTDFADLNEIHVTTGFPGPGSTPEEQAEIQQVTIVYDFVNPLWTEQPPTLSTPPPAAGANP
jgi:hypothetical protein